MQKTARHLLLVSLALIVLAVFLRWWTGRSSEANDIRLAGWGGGNLPVSEEAYYGDRIGGIISAWMEMGRRAEHDEDGRLREPYRTFLVIDCEQREIRIEEAGHVLEEYRSELPRQMTWTLHHDDGRGAGPLDPVVRLKYRGIDPARQYPEMIWLAGQRPNEFFALHFTCREQGRSRIRGRSFRAYHNAPPRKEGVEYYASILASDAEYEQARLSGIEASTEETPGLGLQKTEFEENGAAWSSIRKKLYQAIEGQVNRAGFHLSELRVQPGPDYSAAHAQMHVDRQGIIPGLLGRNAAFYSYLLIDYLGNDVWYAKTQIVPNPQLPVWPRRGPNPLQEMPLEFLVSAGPAVPSSARQAWIEKGREKQRQSTEPRAQWTATLANGVVVTFLGVCKYPSEGRRWWGPDGSTIDYTFYSPLHGDDHGSGNRRAFAFAWQVQQPDSTAFQNMSEQHGYEGGSPFHSSLCRDRYGVVVGSYESCTFGWSQGQTTLTVDADVNMQGFCSVRFKNISLVPGQNQGLEIEVVE